MCITVMRDLFFVVGMGLTTTCFSESYVLEISMKKSTEVDESGKKNPGITFTHSSGKYPILFCNSNLACLSPLLVLTSPRKESLSPLIAVN